jgi:stage V sporulation protein S
MNRFFSKLDLRDIKIDPEGSRFPPDADEAEASDGVKDRQDEFRAAPVVNDADDDLQAESPSYGHQHGQYAPVEDVVESNGHAPVESNGHAPAEANGYEPAESVAGITSYTEAVVVESTAAVLEVEGEIVGVAGEVLKVSARSRPSAVAGAIAGVVREAGRAEVQAIGAGATNQAVKAVAIARDYLRETGIEAICVPAFIDVTIDNEDRTAIRLVVEPR